MRVAYRRRETTVEEAKEWDNICTKQWSVNLATKSEDACYCVYAMHNLHTCLFIIENLCARFFCHLSASSAHCCCCCWRNIVVDVCHCIFVQITDNLHFYVRTYAIRIISRHYQCACKFSKSSFHARCKRLFSLSSFKIKKEKQVRTENAIASLTNNSIDSKQMLIWFILV